ncbi:DUF6266 family protein [Pedobacter sp. MC2016-14]|uniref:DUF6266 family protein n=1 Tax=Pedobacter sp. MC2016-14 TaxID=2897327 RepID=UPI001E40AA39|nr:DUF6266 family protein [Pedobacter sp. MC2016-14]MCD0487796.1 DUF6266 family protein [Pedobacter sp. MC2016-14]
MGKLNNGLFGPFTGKIGKLVGSSRNGLFYVKSAPVRTKPFTAGELANQHRFRVAEAWLKPLLSFVKVGFNNDSPKRGRSAAKSYFLKNAIKSEGMAVTVFPELMKVSMGNLSLSENMHVAIEEELNLRFSWDKNYVANGKVRDQIMMLAYDVTANRAYSITAGAFRYMGTDLLAIDPKSRGNTLHIYAAFNAENRKDQSESVYLGSLVI